MKSPICGNQSAGHVTLGSTRSASARLVRWPGASQTPWQWLLQTEPHSAVSAPQHPPPSAGDERLREPHSPSGNEISLTDTKSITFSVGAFHGPLYVLLQSQEATVFVETFGRTSMRDPCFKFKQEEDQSGITNKYHRETHSEDSNLASAPVILESLMTFTKRTNKYSIQNCPPVISKRF